MSWHDTYPTENRYFETANGIIYNGDCYTILSSFSNKSVDLVITDPPYGINASKGVGGYGVYKANKYDDTWDSCRPEKAVFDRILEVGKNCIIFGGNYFADMLPVSTHWLFWDKKGDIAFSNPYSDGELMWTSFKNTRTKKYTCIQQGFIREDKSQRVHPTQKPVPLLKQLILDYSDEFDIILDPFLGSGSLAVACEELNRRWIGIEISMKYVEIAIQRIKGIARDEQVLLF